ncbi:MAG: apolipoprotein N-acyltransferase [Novosphingobium sp.]|nr:apolipoprotein N-acyltransferase [Novosphingobium sp.]
MGAASLLLERLARHPRRLALLLGAMSAAGFQPLALWPLTLICVGALFLLVARTGSVRDALVIGWLFGWTHFTVANNWIATAFTYQAQMSPLLGWIAVPLLSLYLAVYPALAAGGARALVGYGMGRGTSQGASWPLAFAFAGCWIVAEWLRGWVFTGYAWDPLGVVLLGGFHSQGLAALAPWLGTYALSGLAALIAAGGALLAARRRLVPLGIAAGALAAVQFLLPAPAERPSDLALTLVQPDVRQEELNDPARFEEQFARIAGLSLPERPGERRLVLWPESGVPDYLRDGYPQAYYNEMTAGGDPAYARARIGRVIGPGSLLMTGTVDLEIAGARAVGARNVVTAIDSTGQIRAGYAKAHLVPFGEYLALRWLLEPLGASRLVAGSIDFWPGPGPRTLDLGPWGQAGIQICYEITFSGEVTDPEHRPGYIFNPSNDGWFGSWGPPQHLAQARLRAIEEGLPVLRATTTGISAVIDSYGIVRQFVPIHRAERIDTHVPAALPPTPFARLGNMLPLGWAVVLLAIALVARRRGRG